MKPHRTPSLITAAIYLTACAWVRGEKLVWAKTFLYPRGDHMEAEENAAKQNGDSVCAAMHLLKRSVPTMGKERLTLSADARLHLARVVKQPRLLQL